MKTTTLILVTLLYSIQGISQLNTKTPEPQQELTELPEDADPSTHVVEQILNDLLKMKLISTKDKVSFMLTNDKFEVNDKLQSEEIFQKFKKKYHLVKGYTISYSKYGSSTSTSIVK